MSRRVEIPQTLIVREPSRLQKHLQARGHTRRDIVETVGEPVEVVGAPEIRSHKMLKQKTLRKTPITRRLNPIVSESVGDIRIINGASARPFQPRSIPTIQPKYVYNPRRYGETVLGARRFGPSNFWNGTPIASSPKVGDVRIFEAENLLTGFSEVGFCWNIPEQRLDVYATRNGETYKVRFSTRRLVHLFNRGLREKGSHERLTYPRPTVGWNLFDEIGKLTTAIDFQMIQPAVRDIGKAIDTVANNPVVQGIVTGMALIPPLTAIGGPALAALSVAKGVKAAGDVVGGVSTAIREGFKSPEQALGLINNVVSGIPGLPNAAQGIMQGALGAVGVGVKVANAASRPAAVVTQSGSPSQTTIVNAPTKKKPVRWKPPKGMRMASGAPDGSSPDAQFAQALREARAAGVAIPAGLVRGLSRIRNAAKPGLKVPGIVVDRHNLTHKPTLHVKTPNGSTVPINQTDRYLVKFLADMMNSAAGYASTSSGYSDAELRQLGANPGLLAWSEKNASSIQPIPSKVSGSLAEHLARLSPMVFLDFQRALEATGHAKPLMIELLGTLTVPPKRDIYATLYNNPRFAPLTRAVNNLPTLKHALTSPV